jgi:hypothetical protein
MLDGKLEVVQPTSLHAAHKVELVANVCQWLWVHAHLFVRNCEARDLLGSLLQKLGDQNQQKMVGNQADKDTDRNREETKHKSNGPESSALLLLGDLESRTTDKDDKDLSTTHNGTDTDEKPVLGKALKDVKFVVQAAVTVYVSIASHWAVTE